MNTFAKNQALADLLAASLPELAAAENIAPEAISRGIEAGTMVLLGNPAHKNVTPTLVGQPARIKVNANIGTSPLASDACKESDKLRAAEMAGAHTLMDLSTAGDLDAIRVNMLASSPLPLGTVPVYAVAQRFIGKAKDPADMTWEEMLDEIVKQAEQGVDFMTLHCGVTRKAAELGAGPGRVLGIVSRGGSILARWMRKNGRENPLYERYDELLPILREKNVTISLGDGLRPGAGADAIDAAQMEEVRVLGELAARAHEAGVQTMIEGPGHVPMHLVMDHIREIKRLTGGRPLYVLGPLVIDSAPGYDHIGAAIGGAMAGLAGADFLCYVTPAEHLTLPCAEDVRQGVMASRVAAHAAHVAQGRPDAVARDRDISRARKELDWDLVARLALDPDLVRHRRADHSGEKECAMCGKFCAIRMLGDV